MQEKSFDQDLKLAKPLKTLTFSIKHWSKFFEKSKLNAVI